MSFLISFSYSHQCDVLWRHVKKNKTKQDTLEKQTRFHLYSSPIWLCCFEMTSEASDWSQRSAWVCLCVCSFPCLVVFKMTTSSFCLLASISFHLCMVIPHSREAEQQATHTHTQTYSLFSSLPFNFHFPFTFICLLKQAHASLLWATVDHLFKKSNISSLLFDVHESHYDCLI